MELEIEDSQGLPLIAMTRRCSSLLSSATREKSARSVARWAASSRVRRSETSPGVARSAARRAATVSRLVRTAKRSAIVDASGGGHDRPTPRGHRHEPLGLDDPQRLTNRVARDAEVRCEAVLGQPLPGGIVAVDDPVSQLHEDLIAQRKVLASYRHTPHADRHPCPPLSVMRPGRDPGRLFTLIVYERQFMSLVLPTTAPLGVESLAAVPLLTWLLAISPVVLLLVLVLWGRFSTIVNAGVTVVYSAAVALVAFGAGSLTIAVSLGKGAWVGLWILYVIWPALFMRHFATRVGMASLGRALSTVLHGAVRTSCCWLGCCPPSSRASRGSAPRSLWPHRCWSRWGSAGCAHVALPLIGYH